MKAYTDLEQSKKLAKILALETADMYYEDDISVEFGHGWHPQHFPCWSLAALLDVLPKRLKEDNVLRIYISEDFAIWYDKIGCGVNTELPDVTMECFIDACVSMIEKLHEQKLL